MRVLHVGKYFPPHPGGIEVFVADLANQQHNAGLSPTVLAHGSKHKPADATYSVVTAPTWARVAYTPISPGFGRRLNRLVLNLRPDVIHFHLPNASAFWALWHSATRQIPWVVHWHSDVLTQASPWQIRTLYGPYSKLESRLLERAGAIIATSQNYRDASPVLAQHLERTNVIPLGLEPARYPKPDQDTRRWAFDQFGAGLKVLGLGRLSHYKGFSTLVSALGKTHGMTGVLAGDGEQRRQLSALANAEGTEAPTVRLLGHVSDTQATALLQTCDVVVLPSLQRTEAFGLVLLEAMMAGKPVIASDIKGSGMPWVVQQGRHGKLIEPGNETQLIEALQQMRDDPAMRSELGSSGRAAFDHQFHIRATEKAIRAVYRRITS